MEIVKSKKEVKGGSVYQAVKFENVGDSVTILVTNLGTRTSAEYGDFCVLEGVGFTQTPKDDADFRNSFTPISIKLDTVLKNAWTNHHIKLDRAYEIKFVLPARGKYQDVKTGQTKQAKANHYNIMELDISMNAFEMLKNFANTIDSNSGMANAVEADSEPTEAPVAKPRI